MPRLPAKSKAYLVPPPHTRNRNEKSIPCNPLQNKSVAANQKHATSLKIASRYQLKVDCTQWTAPVENIYKVLFNLINVPGAESP